MLGKPHETSFPYEFFMSKTGLVRIVNGRVLIRPLGSTVTFTANLFRLLAIATDRFRDVFLSKSTRYDSFSIGHDSPRKTRFHSHSIISNRRNPA